MWLVLQTALQLRDEYNAPLTQTCNKSTSGHTPNGRDKRRGLSKLSLGRSGSITLYTQTFSTAMIALSHICKNVQIKIKKTLKT